MRCVKKMNVNQLSEIFYKNYCLVRLKPTTCNGYFNNIKLHILPYIGDIYIDKLSVSDVDSLFFILKNKGLNNTSIRYVLIVLRKMLSFAVFRGYTTKNIMDFVSIPTPARYNYVVWDDDIIKYVIDIIYNRDFKPYFLLPCLLLSLHYGLRRGEVMGLKWSDFTSYSFKVSRTKTYIKDSFVSSTPKNGKFREIMLLPKDYDYFVDYNHNFKSNIDGYFIRDNLGNCPTHLDRPFKMFINKYQLPSIRYHDLRHSYATYMLRHGVHPKIVSSVLGHSSIDITLDLYSHADISMQKACLNVL